MRKILIGLALLILMSLISIACDRQTEYDSKMVEYKNLYKYIVESIDPENLDISIREKNLTEQYQKICEAYNYLIDNANEHNSKNITIFSLNNDVLQDLFDNLDLYSNSGKGIYKIRVKYSIENLKNNLGVDIRYK